MFQYKINKSFSHEKFNISKYFITMMKGLMKFIILSYSLIRPSLFIIPFISFVMGFYWRFFLLILSEHRLLFPSNTPPFNIIFAIFLLGVFSNIINSYIDSRDTDRYSVFLKDYKNIFVENRLNSKHVLIIVILLCLLSFTTVYIYNPRLTLFILAGVLISILYSYYPRCKGIYPFDILLNTIGLFIIPFIFGWILHDEIYSIPLDMLFGFSLISSSFFILTTMVDYDADKAVGLRTAAIALGLKNSAKICLLLIIVGIFISIKYLIQYPQLNIFFIPLTILFIYLNRNPSSYTALQVLRMIIVLSILYPLYSIIIYNNN